jgi:hypothetical protein
MPILSENYKIRPKHNWLSKIVRKYNKIRVNLAKPRNPISDNDVFKRVEEKKQLVIQVICGGLGDHLIYSSLPELLWKQKGIKTFVSAQSVFRSGAIRDFVWGLNPYVEFTNRKGWFTNKASKYSFPTMDSYFQNLFQLQGDGCPKVYYKPCLIERLKGKSIVDPSCGAAGKANGYFDADFYKEFISYLRNNVGQFVLIVHKHPGSKTGKNSLQELIKTEFHPELHFVSTFEELSDALYSAGERYVLHSGAASLSAALNLRTNVLNYLKPSAYNSFLYPLNKHIHLID